MWSVKNLAMFILFFFFGQISTIITFTEILPSTKTIASFKVPDYNSGKVQSLASFLLENSHNDHCFLNIRIFIQIYLFFPLAVGGAILP